MPPPPRVARVTVVVPARTVLTPNTPPVVVPVRALVNAGRVPAKSYPTPIPPTAAVVVLTVVPPVLKLLAAPNESLKPARTPIGDVYPELFPFRNRVCPAPVVGTVLL